MTDRTAPNQDWHVADEQDNVPTWERAAIAVLMDIRRELRNLNSMPRCPNFQAIPSELRAIRRQTVKPRKRRGK